MVKKPDGRLFRPCCLEFLGSLACAAALWLAAGCMAGAEEAERDLSSMMTLENDVAMERAARGFTAVRFDSQTGAPIPAAAGTGSQGAEEAPTSPSGEAAPTPAPQATEAGKRLMVYSASFNLLVANVSSSIERFVKRAEELGGYLERRENDSATCRVPAKSFKDLTAELRTYGLVINESTRALDVTKQFMDLSVRIENAEKARQRLLAILENAAKVEDALRIESEVRRLSEEIDKLKGELKLLSEQIAYSTITVNFRSNAPEPVPVPRRVRSRFDWVNKTGVEYVIENF